MEQARKSSNPGAFEELAGFAFRDRLRSEGVSAAVAELDGLDMTPEQRLDLMLDGEQLNANTFGERGVSTPCRNY